MKGMLLNLQNDSTLLLIVGIAIVVLLIIVLVVVVFSSKAKTLADKVYDLREIDEEKSLRIAALEQELQTYQVKNAAQEQELQQFAETKEILSKTAEAKQELEKRCSALENLTAQTKTKLESTEEMYANLLEEHKALQLRNEKLREDNSKYHTNNARLLTKLESETRHTHAKMEMMQSHKKELRSEFEALAKKIFEGNSQKFAEFSKENLDNMIKPLQVQINEFKKQVERKSTRSNSSSLANSVSRLCLKKKKKKNKQNNYEQTTLTTHQTQRNNINYTQDTPQILRHS